MKDLKIKRELQTARTYSKIKERGSKGGAARC